MDGTGIFVARNTSVLEATVVWSGTSYVVLWNIGQTIYAVRVTRDGRVEGAPRVIARKAQTNLAIAAASNGSRIVVTYMSVGGPATAEIHAVILDSDANVITDLLLAGSEVNRSIPTVAASRDQFLVIWERLTASPWLLEGMRLDGRGVPLDAAPRTIASGESPVLASDGRDFVLLAYQSAGRYVSRKIAADLTAFPEYEIASAVQNPAGLLPGALSIDGLRSGPALIRGGDGTFIAWTDASIVSTVYAARISSATRAFEGSPMRT